MEAVVIRKEESSESKKFHPFYVLYLRQNGISHVVLKEDDVKKRRKRDILLKELNDPANLRRKDIMYYEIARMSRNNLVMSSKQIIRPNISLEDKVLSDSQILEIISHHENYADAKLREQVIYPVIGSQYYMSNNKFVTSILSNCFVLVKKLKKQASLFTYLCRHEQKKVDTNNLNEVSINYQTSKARDLFNEKFKKYLPDVLSYCSDVCQKKNASCTNEVVVG